MMSMSKSMSMSGECEEKVNGGNELQQQLQQQQHDDDDEEGSIISASGSVHSPTIDPDAVDVMLAKAMDDLSFQERNNIYEEIHGVSNMSIKETPQLIEESLRRLSVELESNIDNGNIIESKKYYDYAESCAKQQQINSDIFDNTNNNTSRTNNNCYHSCMNNEFRLRFLRCDLFNPKLAAQRIYQFYDCLYSLYGLKGIEKFVSLTATSGNNNNNNNNNQTTTTTTTLMDFFFGENKNDMMLFKSGYIQCLPFRDRSGRKIIVFNLDALANLKSTIRLKIWIYMMFVASEDTETQRNGVVVIFWPGMDNIDGHIPNSRHRLLVRKTVMGMPTRSASLHFCFPNTHFFNILRSVLTMVMSPLHRLRVKLHTGERMEMQYELMGYGIPISLIPTTETGRLKTKNCLQWIKARKLLEQYKNNNNNNNKSNNNTTVNNKVNGSNNVRCGNTTTSNNASQTQAQAQVQHHNTQYNNNNNNNDDGDSLLEGEVQTSALYNYDAADNIVVRIECPGVNDVIFRSAGKSCMNNPGNVVFRGIFENYHDEHVAANQTDKKNIVWSIVEQIENSNGKFLNWDKRGWWIPIHDRNEMRSKVAISFRDYNKQRRADLNQQLIKSSTYAFKRQDGKRRKGLLQTGNKNDCSSTSSSGGEEEGGILSDGGSSSSDNYCGPSNCMKRSYIV